MKFTKEQVLGVVRHVFTFLGGFLVMRGAVDETLFLEASGAVITLVGAVWSILQKKTTLPTEETPNS